MIEYLYALIVISAYLYIAFFALGVATGLQCRSPAALAIAWPISLLILGAFLAVRAGLWVGAKLDGPPLTETPQDDHHDQTLLRPLDD